eukprot:2044703-Heterocapsa_arctica.AAC.1
MITPELNEHQVRPSKELGSSKCSANLKSMEANSDHSINMMSPELNQHLVTEKWKATETAQAAKKVKKAEFTKVGKCPIRRVEKR